MSAAVFIGDEVSAAGFRLAGARVRTPEPEDLAQTLAWACSEAQLIIITSEYANRLERSVYEQCLAGTSPLFIVIPDIRGRHKPEDLAIFMRRQIGVLE
jgi:vacuolar-type H+-ATPase subunit F/Vma7